MGNDIIKSIYFKITLNHDKNTIAQAQGTHYQLENQSYF